MNKSEMPAEITELTQRFNALRDDKVRAETTLKTAEEALQKLKREALEQFQTDDPDELQQTLEAMEAENLRLRAEYQKQLETIRDELEAIDAKYRAEP